MKRASGTFWERQATGPALYLIPFPILYAYFANEPRLGLIAYWFTIVVSLLADLIAFSRFDLRSIYCANNRLIAEDINFTPSEVAYIREISYGGTRNSWEFIEFVLNSNGSPVRVLCPAKRRWYFAQNPTIRIVLEHFPELAAKVKLSYSTYWSKKVKAPPPPEPELEPYERHAVNPASRCKDPYFRRP